jgi:CDP-6-deoxy-D-xylo-4-hexulose-3-dehydrase
MKIKNFLRVNYGSTVHGKDEVKAVVNVLNNTTQMGKNVRQFETKIAKIFKKKYGVMTNSGTSALLLAIEAMNFKKNSEIITPALTFGTTVGSIVKNNLIPVFIDVKLNTLCIDEEKIEKKITKNTRAILAPDLIGNICNWIKIKKIAKKYKLLVIQDSADTLGSTINGLSTGSYSDLSITSFYGSHIINGAGNGGMLCTSNLSVFNKTKILRSWGRSSSLFNDSESIENRFDTKIDNISYDKKFIFEAIGYQLEPSEISAAFALVQLTKLKSNARIRQKNFKLHYDFFKKYENFFHLPQEEKKVSTAWLAYPVLIKKNKFFTRTDLQIFLEKRNIQTRVIFTGNVLRQPGFKNIKCIGKPDDFPVSDEIMKYGMLIGCHHGLKEKHISHVHNSINTFLKSFI